MVERPHVEVWVLEDATLPKKDVEVARVPHEAGELNFSHTNQH